MKPLLKICGMKYNVAEMATLQPAYLGFIFYEKSPRNFEGSIPIISTNIKKVGVFVNEVVDIILEKIMFHKLDVIQLHGEESPEYISELNTDIEVWKVFSVGETFDFNQLTPYEKVVDKFLFDTKGKNQGGNGVVFNWGVLQNYSSKKPFILSGGIGLEEVDAIHKLIERGLPIYAIDVNSKFEIRPGLKNSRDLKQFIDEL